MRQRERDRETETEFGYQIPSAFTHDVKHEITCRYDMVCQTYNLQDWGVNFIQSWGHCFFSQLWASCAYRLHAPEDPLGRCGDLTRVGSNLSKNWAPPQGQRKWSNSPTRGRERPVCYNSVRSISLGNTRRSHYRLMMVNVPHAPLGKAKRSNPPWSPGIGEGVHPGLAIDRCVTASKLADLQVSEDRPYFGEWSSEFWKEIVRRWACWVVSAWSGIDWGLINLFQPGPSVTPRRYVDKLLTGSSTR